MVSMTHSNEAMVRKAYDALGKGDIPKVLSAFADDIQWHELGSSPLSGEYKGKQEVLGFFGKLMELSEGTFHLRIEEVLGNDRYVLALVEEHGERDGKTLAVDAVHVWKINNNTATEFWCYPADQNAFGEFFS
jgi:uncharacterized protein